MTTLTLSTSRKVSTEAIEKAAELARVKFPYLESYQAGFDGGFLDLYAFVTPVKTYENGDQDFAGFSFTFCEGVVPDAALTYYDIRLNTVEDGWIDSEPDDATAYNLCQAQVDLLKKFFFDTIGLTEADLDAVVL
jgi:hypothetical protein